MSDRVDAALDEARGLLDDLSAPDYMSAAEAKEFYEGVVQHAEIMAAGL